MHKLRPQEMYNPHTFIQITLPSPSGITYRISYLDLDNTNIYGIHMQQLI